MLDTVKRGTIVALVRLGGSRRMAAREVGCSASTITRAAARDPNFAARLAHAESLSDRRSLELISRAVEQEKYWRAAAWMLERRNPEEFDRRAPHTFTSEQVITSPRCKIGSHSPRRRSANVGVVMGGGGCSEGRDAFCATTHRNGWASMMCACPRASRVPAKACDERVDVQQCRQTAKALHISARELPRFFRVSKE